MSASAALQQPISMSPWCVPSKTTAGRLMLLYGRTCCVFSLSCDFHGCRMETSAGLSSAAGIRIGVVLLCSSANKDRGRHRRGRDSLLCHPSMDTHNPACRHLPADVRTVAACCCRWKVPALGQGPFHTWHVLTVPDAHRPTTHEQAINLTRTNPLSYFLGTGCSTNPVRGRGFIHYPSLLVAFFST